MKLNYFFSFVFHKLPARAWNGAAWGVGITASIVWGALAWTGFAPAGVSALIFGWLGGILVGILFGGVILVLGWLLNRFPKRFGLVALGALPLLASAYLALPLAYGMMAVIAGLLLTASLFGTGVFSLLFLPLARAQRNTALILLIIGGFTLLGGGAFLLSDGFPIQPPPNAAKLSAQNVIPLDMQDPSKPGNYSVRTLTYGSGTDLLRAEYGTQSTLRTSPVDGSELLKGWSIVRRAYWGFGPEAMPLNARVWMPDQEGVFPLILVVHGNHPMEDYSENGYDYLAELLASRGFIVASLDQNFLNLSLAANFGMVAPLKDENDARAWLILEHLRQWKTWATTPGNPFFNRVNLDRIGLIGHSRGGEAVALAAAFNRLPRHPDNGTLRFDYDFNIHAVAAIAPVDGQYLPGDRRLPLEDVNYLVLHGVHDMDVVSFSGMRQYTRLEFQNGKPYFKAALYIYGANHGQFNHSWGRHDMLGPARQLFNLDALLPAAQQEQVAKVTISAFMEATLHDQVGYQSLFRDPRTAAAWLPDTIILSQYQDSHTVRIATFEEDINLETATIAGATLRGEGLTLWREQIVPLKWGSMENSSVYIGWDTETMPGLPCYVLTLSERNLPLWEQTRLTFSLAASDESPHPGKTIDPSNEQGVLDLSIELVDYTGNAARLPLRYFSLLQPPLRGQLGKLNWMSALPISEVIFQTFEFRLGDFKVQNPLFDPQNLSVIRFVFDRTPSGIVILDEIGFQP